jgi:hypothetical protein
MGSKSFRQAAEGQEQPADHEAEAAEGGEGPEPMRLRQGHSVEAAAEEDDAGEEEIPRPADAGAAGQEEHDGSVDEVVTLGRLPDLGGAERLQLRLQAMGAEGAERDPEKAKEGRNASRSARIHAI